MASRFVDIRGIVYHHCVKLSFLIFLNSIIHVVKIMIVSNRASNITNDMQMYLLRRIPVRGDSQHNTIYVDMHRKKAHGFGKDVKLIVLARMLSTRLLRSDMLLFLLELSLLKHDMLIFTLQQSGTTGTCFIYIFVYYPRPPPKKGPYRFCVGCLSSRSN